MDQLIGVQMELSETPYNLVLKLVDSLEDELRIYTEWAAERRVDGVLLTDLELQDERVDRLRELGIRTSAVAAQSELKTGDDGPDACVSGRDITGLHAIIEHLHDLGHRRIGWIAGPPNFIASQRRLEALDDWRDSFDSIATSHATLHPASIALEAEKLQHDHTLTALVVDNELAAIETVARLHSAGLTVPDDVSVVSWLGSDLCLLSDPQITALEHDVTGLGQLWARALLTVTYDDVSASPREIDAPTLHVRSSTVRSH